ncbi:MAG: leucine--tRNA ligase [Candidatus Nanoarchaeia archaeon]|nr:leucine--tRNA ligase [Candidatus Nanoarchaeia archaeon]
MVEIDFKAIEKKWQEKWEKAKCFEVSENSKKKKYYVLEMYPYPSASFLHMGHVRNYTIGDVYARFKRMNGFNVLYPMGYDSFGLPAETAAKKEGIHPKKYAETSIKMIMKYQKALGNSYDWSRVIASHEPDYYKWNQYFFLKLYEKGLAYRKKAPVNWCEKCQSVLANEEAESGKCWRCGEEVVKKDLEQWFFKITKYADRLISDLDKIEWPERIKVMQKNWIGKSHGTEIDFSINGEKWPVFTTRPDTIYGVTFLVISAQHPRLMELVSEKQKKEVEKLLDRIKKVKSQEEIESLEKDGVFTGSYAINPINNEKIPVYAGNFVIADYGCGVVMAVPAHDERDFQFAKKYKIPIKVVINPDSFDLNPEKMSRAYTPDGRLINSGEFNNWSNREAMDSITEYLAKKKLGRKTINYKIRDWLISRQRYWGTPMPMIYCDKCGIVPVPEKDLPVLLPEKVDFKSVGNPLASSKIFVEVKCPKCNGKARRETDTMGGFVDSSWYFLRYCDSRNKKKAFDEIKVNYWMPVDQYIGGAEHAVMHLMYARFFIKALKDLGYVKFDEPFTRLFNQGIVYKDGAKMSKSKGNVVFQTDISDKYGIDTARLFLMFVSSPDKQMEWSDDGVEGAFRIINRLIRISENLTKTSDKLQDHKINLAIKKVTEAIEIFEYPKAIISIVECLDKFSEGMSKENFGIILRMISPFCPHIAEELWEKIGKIASLSSDKNSKIPNKFSRGFISLSDWPVCDEKKIDENLEKQEQAVEKLILDLRNILKILEGKGEKKSQIKIFVIPNELEIYKNANKKIEQIFGMKTEILSIKEAISTGKKIQAKPGKPGIFLE